MNRDWGFPTLEFDFNIIHSDFYIIMTNSWISESRVWQKVFGLIFRLPETLLTFCTYGPSCSLGASGVLILAMMMDLQLGVGRH